MHIFILPYSNFIFTMCAGFGDGCLRIGAGRAPGLPLRGATAGAQVPKPVVDAVLGGRDEMSSVVNPPVFHALVDHDHRVLQLDRDRQGGDVDAFKLWTGR